MPTIEEIALKKLEALEAVPEAFDKLTVKSQKTVFREILKLIDRLDRKGDQLLINKKNFKLIDDIANKSRGIITDSEYFRGVKQLVNQMDAQMKLNNEYYQGIFENITIPSSASELLRFAKNDAINTLISGSTLTQVYSQPLKKVLQKAVSSGSSWSNTIDEIRMITTGDQERLGLLNRYASQIVRDTFSQADANYTNIINQENNIEWYVYRGGRVRDSRDFCVKRDGKYYHINEVRKWANGDWAGKIPGTNSDNIFTNRGGFQCLHSIMATSIFAVPKDVLKRNMGSGNFYPDADLKKELGL